MKELENKASDIEIVTQVTEEQKKQLKFLGKKQLGDGHSVFELNLETGLINYAQYIDEAVKFTDKGKSVSRKVFVKENHIYATALNIKNAHKKFIKHLKGIR